MEDEKLNVEQVNRAINILNDKPVKVSLFGKEMEIAPPSYGTILEACRYLQFLPKEKINEGDNMLLAKLVEIAPQTQPALYAVAVMLYGEHKCNKKEFFGLLGKRNIERYVRRLYRECSPAEIRNAMLTLLGSQVVGDFFGFLSAIMTVLIVESK